MVKRLPAMRATWVRFLGWEDLLEKETATHSSTLAWRIPQTKEPGRLQSMGLQSQTQLSDFTCTFFFKTQACFPPLIPPRLGLVIPGLSSDLTFMVPLRLSLVILAPPMLGPATLIFPRSSLSSRSWQGLWTESLYCPGLLYCQGCSLPPPSQCCGGGPWLSLTVCGVELWNYIS